MLSMFRGKSLSPSSGSKKLDSFPEEQGSIFHRAIPTSLPHHRDSRLRKEYASEKRWKKIFLVLSVYFPKPLSHSHIKL